MVKTNETCVLSNKAKTYSVNKKVIRMGIIALVLMCIFSNGAFAAGNGTTFQIDALNSLGDVLVGALGSTWLKAILATALVIEFGVAAWGQSKGASELVSGAVKWMFATGGMLGATGIANFIFDEVDVNELSLLFNSALPIIG